MAKRAGWRWTRNEALEADELSGDLGKLEALVHEAQGLRVPARHVVLPAYSAIVAVARVVEADRAQRTGWDVPELWHWRLGDVRRLVEPVPCNGSRGLWEVGPDTADLVRRRIAS